MKSECQTCKSFVRHPRTVARCAAMSAVVSRGRVANGRRVHVSGAAAAPVRRIAGLSPRAFFLPITHLRHFLTIRVSASYETVL